MPDRTLLASTVQRDGRGWCLFLDRDGVINTRILDGYVRTWADFTFVPGAVEALARLADWAPRIVVVTNQQGVGKGLMSPHDLADIHERMTRAVVEGGGRIDAVQFCPHLADAGCSCRKPLVGMATDYLDAHPAIEGALSIMVGDTPSDVAMGRNLGLATGGCLVIRIDGVEDAAGDITYSSLSEFASAVDAARRAADDHSAA